MSVIAHVDHGKSTLTDSLIAYGSLMASEKAGDTRYTDIDEEEKNRGITIKSTGISLVLKSDAIKEGESKDYLVNLIDSPGHIDFSAEVTAALRITDGALVVVDYVEGVAVQTKTVLRQALSERVKPVVIINKIDRAIEELQVDGETMYQNFLRQIENVNTILSAFEGEEQSLQINPVEGTCAFGSAKFGWGFTLTRFAKDISKKIKCNPDTLVKNLWGDHYYNMKTGKWQTTDTDADGNKLQRGFVQFIMDPIIQLFNACMKGDFKVIDKEIEKRDIRLTQDERKLEGKLLMKCVFMKWILAAEALLEMIIEKLPSPIEAQAYRAANLYEGPQDDESFKAIQRCDKDGPVMMYVSKMIPAPDNGRFYAFGRVFSGTIKAGARVRIMGPEYQPGSNNDLHVQNVTSTVIWMAGKEESVPEVPCGNTVALGGIDKYLVKQGTIATAPDAHTIKAMKYSVSPVVRVSVSVKAAKDLPNLIKGLQRLSKSDPLVQCTREETGEHVVAGCGELHVEICLKNLVKYAGCEVQMGTPIVSYKETVTEESSAKCFSKATNKLCRIQTSAQPIPDQLCKMIEDQKIGPKVEPRLRSNILCEEFGWDRAEAQKIWCFGPETSGPNLLVDSTSAVQYLHQIRPTVEQSFQWVAREGPMCGEPLRGVRFDIHDALVHAQSAHRGANQITPMTRRSLYGSMLTATPALQEPIFLCEIQAPSHVKGKVYQVLLQRRGQVIGEEPLVGGMLNLSCHLPVGESFGFNQVLKEATSGQALPQTVFDHWEELSGNPLDIGSKSNLIVEQVRARKGLKAGIPDLSNFFDKL